MELQKAALLYGHAIFDHGTYKEATEGLASLYEAIAQSPMHINGAEVHFGLRLVLPRSAKISGEQRQKILTLKERLEQKDVYTLLETLDVGPISGLMSMLFDNHTFTKMPDVQVIGYNCVFDQLPPNVRASVELAKHVAENDVLYSTAARDINVKLGINKGASDARIIQELIYAMAANQTARSIGFDGFVPKGTHSRMLPGYETFGEITSGFYFANRSHKRFADWQEIVWKSSRVAQARFSVDYYMAMLAAGLGRVESRFGEMETKENMFYFGTPPTPEEELARVSAEMVKTCKDVAIFDESFGNGGASQELAKVIGEPKTKESLRACSYDKTQVAQVMEWMAQGLAQAKVI